jgi:LmbE family N-acetylglucosaminyl deacetylase
MATRFVGDDPAIVQRSRVWNWSPKNTITSGSDAEDALGGTSLELLPYLDPCIDVGAEGRAFNADFDPLTRQLIRRMDQVGVQVLISHVLDGEYSHPAHQLMHDEALQAIRSGLDRARVMYSFAAIWPDHPRPRLANPGDPAHFVVSIKLWFSVKLQAERCHRAQAASFIRRPSKEAGRALGLEEVLLREESLRRAWPPPDETPSDPLAEFLQTRCRAVLEERGPSFRSGGGRISTRSETIHQKTPLALTIQGCVGFVTSMDHGCIKPISSPSAIGVSAPPMGSK